MSADPDISLGIPGFTYGDLHQPERLRDLSAAFQLYLSGVDPALAAEHERYLETRGEGLARTAESALLVRVAPHVSEFVARLFGVESERRQSIDDSCALDPIFRLKKELVQRRAAKKAGDAAIARLDLSELEEEVRAIQAAVLEPSERDGDPELVLARAACRLLDLEQAFDRELSARDARPAPAAAVSEVMALQGKLSRYAADDGAAGTAAHKAFAGRVLHAIEAWAARTLAEEHARHAQAAEWVSFRLPEKLRFPDGLVAYERPDAELPELIRGADDKLRRRDGFKLTDPRWSEKEAVDHTHYCVLCHDREKDSCSRGFPLPREARAAGKNALGTPLIGCPLEEKISEAHALRRAGDSLAALAVIMIDNPMCPATGHRICNDCMKACIFQKQEPVNIPQIETSCLTSVLALPYGVEIYGLLTRWNPLNARRPHALPYNGKNVLVVGLGPAGINLAHWLLNEGFGVVGIDGLKIEPLAPALMGADGRSPRPVRDFAAVREELDERIGGGFGGVAEYGITVRWDKSFLTLLGLTLRRRDKLKVYGGVRFGGTIEIEDAWALGCDHIAIAAGAGRPTVVEMKNTLIRNVRTASDFLMGLQLTGAFKRSSLANLQLQLPCIVIGSGLTAIDTATEALAYYPLQVEKTLERFETLAEEMDRETVLERFDAEERETLETFLEHGRQVRAERERAEAAGEAPDFVPLVRRWGGVKICYRKRMVDSPAYRLNHEEIIKCFEEGVELVENVSPLEAVPDERGAVKAVVFERLQVENGEHRPTGQQVTLDARTVFMAAGTTPNIIYEKEYPGTFAVDKKRRAFAPHRLAWTDGAPRLEPAAGTLEDPGFFTSYARGGRFISYFGDNHPVYAGSVVKAMASAKLGHREIAALFAGETGGQRAADQPRREAAWAAFAGQLDDQLIARVEEVVRLTPTVVEVIIRAPLQARKFHPGQFYRLQNYETTAAVIDGTRLQMEGIALTGAWVDKERGLLSLIVLEMGCSSRLCAYLQPGEEVIVMGPTGTPTEIPSGEVAVLCGGGLGNAVLFSVAQALKANGCKVVYFAGYKKPEDVFHQDDIERGCDQVIWSVDRGTAIAPRRPQDLSFVGNIVQCMSAYAAGRIGGPPLFDLRQAKRLISIGSDRMMEAVTKARKGVLSSVLSPEHVAISSINSPMQCMMKEICGQCLQRHLDPESGQPSSYVFTCFNQDQSSDCVDWKNLNDRLRMNGVQEKLSSLWLTRLLERVEVATA